MSRESSLRRFCADSKYRRLPNLYRTSHKKELKFSVQPLAMKKGPPSPSLIASRVTEDLCGLFSIAKSERIVEGWLVRRIKDIMRTVDS